VEKRSESAGSGRALEGKSFLEEERE